LELSGETQAYYCCILIRGPGEVHIVYAVGLKRATFMNRLSKSSKSLSQPFQSQSSFEL
jgi:hypothetical protein